MRKNVLVVDDHKIVRQCLKFMLERQPDINVIGECKNGIEAVRSARQLNPDIVIMDITMPFLNGIEATEQIVKQNPKIRVLAMTMHDNRKFIARIIKSGASGYIIKDSGIEELTKAIHNLDKNKFYVSPEITDQVLQDYKDILSDHDTSELSLLSAREKEVLQLMTEGKSTKMIARILALSPKTVEVHRKNLMEKLGVDNLADLIKFGLREGLTPLDI